MILKKTPKAASVFFSSNEIELHVASELDANHYFEIEILVDDVSFDTQSWAKINDIDCYINLTNQFENIFVNPFVIPTEIAIVRNDFLFKKITVVVKEYNVTTLLEVASETLPDFYIIKNTEIESFNAASEIYLLSKLNALNKISDSSQISIPFWVNTTDVFLEIRDFNGQILESSSLETTLGIYEIKINVADLITIGLSGFTVIINNDTKINYSLVDFFRYPVTTIAVQNKYGFFEIVSLFGKLIKKPVYSKTIKENYKEVATVVEDDVKYTYSLNSGYLSENQRKALDEINKSVNCYLYEDNTYKNVIPNTKNATLKQTNEFAVNSVISFVDNFYNSVDETDKYNLI
jgi:hypothetical protein